MPRRAVTKPGPRRRPERGARLASHPRPSTVADVARQALSYFKETLHPDAVSIFTPFARKVPLLSVRLKPEIKRFITRYEPRAAQDGLYPHQADLLRRYGAREGPNFILTSATGSGKSLCFWAWVLDHLLDDSRATALLCFPTQALMWGQANRLARFSALASLAEQGNVAYAGEIELGQQSIGWTIWKGTGQGYTVDKDMRAHISTAAFRHARIRIATLDKAHYSLLLDTEFTRQLACVVIDEPHSYDGMFGANVHFFLKRLFVAREVAGRKRPDAFLASATLSDAKTFGAALLSLSESGDIVHVADSVTQEIKTIPANDVPGLLATPPPGGLLRVVLLLDEDRGTPRTEAFLSDAKHIGERANAIWFIQNKFHGRQLAMRLRSAKSRGNRAVLTYDADLPPRERREIEARFNSGEVQGTTLIATNSLELGVDIEGLDLCVVDQTPPARQDMLQRIGRVGRRDGRPGLVVLSASLSPADRRILARPVDAFRLDTTSTLPLPTHVEMLRWRHMMAAYNEGVYREYAGRNWSKFRSVMERYFGECPGFQDLKSRFEEAYGDIVDMDGKFWAHHGFRASASQGRVPLIEFGGFDNGKPTARLQSGQRNDIAWIEDTNLFRDAHPEGVFLGHSGGRWRVVAYDGDWTAARNVPAGTDVVLAKWLKTIKAVYVEAVKGNIATRGEWADSHKLYELVADLGPNLQVPSRGRFEYGVWDFERTWRGYRQIDLSTGKATRVSLAEVTERFRQAIEEGDGFPFLHALTYRTLGWQWRFGELPPGLGATNELGSVVDGLMDEFVRASLECSAGDVTVSLSLEAKTLSVFDTTPGGNGLSQAVLAGGRMVSAFDECLATLDDFSRKGSKKFREYLEVLLDMESDCELGEVRDVVRTLRERWNR